MNLMGWVIGKMAKAVQAIAKILLLIFSKSNKKLVSI
jgi:predicted RNA-binding protein YlqC (UPF0109 family)